MMQVGVIGINHKQADIILREAIARAILRQFAIGATLQNSVLLVTCNRAELYFSGPDLAHLHTRCLQSLREEMPVPLEFEQKCYSFFGKEAFMHLCRVTSGLDSAIIAETEIQGQVKNAYEAAKNVRTLSSELHFLFQKCLKIAKNVRTHLFEGKKSLPDLEHAILFSAKNYFGKELAAPLFIGASEINKKVARFLYSQGVRKMCFCSRTREHAVLFAEEFQGAVMPWNELLEKWQHYEWIIAATKSPTMFLLGDPMHHGKRLLIDLAVPRNIHPESPGTLLNIDDLNALLQERKNELHESVQLAEEKISAMIGRYETRLFAKPPLAALSG